MWFEAGKFNIGNGAINNLRLTGALYIDGTTDVKATVDGSKAAGSRVAEIHCDGGIAIGQRSGFVNNTVYDLNVLNALPSGAAENALDDGTGPDILGDFATYPDTNPVLTAASSTLWKLVQS